MANLIALVSEEWTLSIYFLPLIFGVIIVNYFKVIYDVSDFNANYL